MFWNLLSLFDRNREPKGGRLLITGTAEVGNNLQVEYLETKN